MIIRIKNSNMKWRYCGGKYRKCFLKSNFATYVNFHNLTLSGSLFFIYYNSFSRYLKENIDLLDFEEATKILNLSPSIYEFYKYSIKVGI